MVASEPMLEEDATLCVSLRLSSYRRSRWQRYQSVCPASSARLTGFSQCVSQCEQFACMLASSTLHVCVCTELS